MLPLQPISAFGLQASNSARKRQAAVTSDRAEGGPQSGRKARGTLRFVDQSSSSRHSATSPIEIEDDSQPVQGTAISWEKEQYYSGDHDPYDETFKPPERDSQDETMVFDTSKTRQQPHRIATTRKPARPVPEAIFSESYGMYTPPGTNRRLIGKGTATGNSKGKEKETPVTSDPVETPVPGPSRQQSHSRTPLTRRKSEIYVDVPDITAKPSSARVVATSASSKTPSARGPKPPLEREKNWLSKRSAQGSASGRTSGIQTKMTAFIVDKAPNVVKNRKLSGAHVEVANGNFEDEDAFDESVRFVSMSKRGSSINADLSDEGVDVVNAPVPKVVRVSTSTRPLPRRKKRKSDEMDTSSDVVVDGPSAAATDGDGDKDDDFSLRLKAHKRFKKQHLLQAGADAVSSENDADETSSLTSLSKGPSSDAQDVGEQEEAPSGLRVKRGRAGRAMQVVYSSEPEENLIEVEVIAHQEPEKEPEVLQGTLSSIVPDSQPWHQYEESDMEGFRLPSSPAKQQLPIARSAEVQSDTVQQDVEAIDRERDDLVSPVEHVPIEVAAESDVDMEPDVDMETEQTQPLEALEEKRLQTAGRALGPEESRTFPFPPEMLQQLKGPLLRYNSSISLSSLRHSEPSQPEFAVPQNIRPARDPFAEVRQRILLSTDDDLESMNVQQPSCRSARPVPVEPEERDVFQEDSKTQQSETLDLSRMRKMLARPKRPVQLQANESTVNTEAVEQIDRVHQSTANAQHSARHTSAGPSHSAIPRRPALAASDAKDHSNDDEGAVPVDVILEDNAELDEGPMPYAAPETETMLPLSLDTQLYRPGILSPNFQLRRRAVATHEPPSTKKIHVDRTPTKQQRFASPLVSPSKSVQTPQKLRKDVEARTVHEHAIPHTVLRSPESMIENVETLATWSPAKYSTSYSIGAMNGQTPMAGPGKENIPFTFGGGSDSKGVAPDSPDEVVEGTYGHIESMHLLETYHRGYTPKKESAVERQEKALPRVTMRMPRPPAPKTAFVEVDQAWEGVEQEDNTPKPSHSARTRQKKDDTAEQSKLASYGFLKNENVRKLRPVGFERAFEQEDDLPDEEDMEQRNFERQSLSPTPRKVSSAKVLGAVPVAPIDPRLRPAGIRELQRRQKLPETTSGGTREHEAKGGDVVKRAREWIEDEAVPSSQPSENQADLFNSDSSTDMALRARLEEIAAPLQIVL